MLRGCPEELVGDVPPCGDHASCTIEEDTSLFFCSPVYCESGMQEVVARSKLKRENYP